MLSTQVQNEKISLLNDTSFSPSDNFSLTNLYHKTIFFYGFLSKLSLTPKDEKYSRREFSYQSFQRSFTIPKDAVDADKIEAKYENGLLHLVIPKKKKRNKNHQSKFRFTNS